MLLEKRNNPVLFLNANTRETGKGVPFRGGDDEISMFFLVKQKREQIERNGRGRLRASHESYRETLIVFAEMNPLRFI